MDQDSLGSGLRVGGRIMILKSLQARNIALLLAVVILGQALCLVLIYQLAIRPQAERVGAIMARNVTAMSEAMATLDPAARDKMIERINASGALKIAKGVQPPEVDTGVPTLLELIFIRSFAKELEQKDIIIWQSTSQGGLWVNLKLGGEPYWLSYLRPAGWSPSGAFFWSFIVAVGLALFGGYLVQRRIAQPLQRLSNAVDRLEPNSLPPPLAVDGPTELAAVANSFNNLRTRILDNEKHRSIMLAGISHDLRTPLAKLRLALAMEKSLTPDTEKLVVRQLDRVDVMLAQFLDFARGASGAEEKLAQPAELVREAAELLDVEIDVFEAEPVHVRTDRQALLRLVLNLIRNASQHGAAPINVTIEREDQGIAIAVRDHGKGVAPENLKRLTEPFYREDSARGTQGGTGLGLAIVKQIAESLGGSVTFASPEGGGLLVSVRLPSR
jgi:two-component system, OmpR family, osmolarity sensor histidine kinase EnvZ